MRSLSLKDKDVLHLVSYAEVVAGGGRDGRSTKAVSVGDGRRPAVMSIPRQELKEVTRLANRRSKQRLRRKVRRLRVVIAVIVSPPLTPQRTKKFRTG